MTELQKLMMRIYQANQEAEAQKALSLRVKDKKRGEYSDYTSTSLEKLLGRSTGQKYNPSLFTRATDSREQNIGGTPTLMEILRQF